MMTIVHERDLSFINGTQIHITIYINSDNRVWPQPMSATFSLKLFEPKIIQKNTSILFGILLLDEFSMPHFPLLLDNKSVVQFSPMNFIKLVDYLEAMLLGFLQVQSHMQ